MADILSVNIRFTLYSLDVVYFVSSPIKHVSSSYQHSLSYSHVCVPLLKFVSAVTGSQGQETRDRQPPSLVVTATCWFVGLESLRLWEQRRALESMLKPPFDEFK